MTWGCTYYYPLIRDYTTGIDSVPCGADSMIAVYWNRIANGVMPDELGAFLWIKWTVLSIDYLLVVTIGTIGVSIITLIHLIKYFGIIGLQKTEYSQVQEKN